MCRSKLGRKQKCATSKLFLALTAAFCIIMLIGVRPWPILPFRIFRAM